MKKALEELGKALEDLVEELVEDQQASSSPLVVCMMLTRHRRHSRKRRSARKAHERVLKVTESSRRKRRSASKAHYRRFGHSSRNPTRRAGLEAICPILTSLAVIQWIKSLLIAKSFVLPQFQHS